MSDIKRKLARIEKIEEIRPIEGADTIECAIVLGWPVVVKKDTFLPDDLCVFFEIDSFLPLNDPRYHFLSKNAIKWNGLSGMRLKTIRLRGQVSQGLVLPLSDFPEIDVLYETEMEETYSNWSDKTQYHLIRKDGTGLEAEDFEAWALGKDLTEMLGILKWEAAIPAQLAGRVHGTFPMFIPKTDEERIQNIFRNVKERTDNYEVTTKLDGSSMTIWIDEKNEVHVASRNWELAETEDNAFWTAVRNDSLKDKMLQLKMALGLNIVAVQGELLGPGVQGNYEGLTALGLYVFNIYDCDHDEYIVPQDRRILCETLGFKQAPLVEMGKTFDFETVDRAVDFADGWSLNPKVRREGVVWKSLDDPSFSFKIVSNHYLINEK